jgi:hypothetical protein
MTTTTQIELKSNSSTTDNADGPINSRDCRKWFRAESGELRPSERGIALGVHHLPKLAEVFTKALSIARERGFLGGQS